MDLRDDKDRAIYEQGFNDAAHLLRRMLGEAMTPTRVKNALKAATHRHIFGNDKAQEKAP